ncbi:hypothetical protein DIS24_g487 [Lasiodiplodia hormozganensis]|uniref:Tyrosinase copper-binding domain-containing protein n=1 Tax=Lasiodiplodia hormozganensis TaxID=869390 RepID=A0AA39Z588_9PEZI|nr:hypothetical protein DIS24_g487 [Lasiodiplodia hormozganensis]
MYVRAHEYLLQSECGYTGGQPYWNETRDIGAIASSTIWDTDTGFGGNGTGTDSCVQDGPFANLTLHFVKNAGLDDYCLSRDFDEETLEGASQTNIDTCLDAEDFETVWDCLEGQPHAAGHGGTGGTMMDLSSSAGDPVFFLHHAWMDKIWWEWQSQNLSYRLTEIGGVNVPPDEYFDFTGLDYPSTAITDYDGDPGNTTTLNHNLWMAGIVDNYTIGDVMDMDNNLNCAEYI